MSDKLYIVIPAYNEAENIEGVVSSWHPIVERINQDNHNTSSKLVIFNDGSKDNTLHVLQSIEDKYPFLVIVDKPNSGHGATLVEAYRYALDNGANFIFQTDSDGQTDPNEFLEFWKDRNDFDLVIGSRTKRQDGLSRILVTNVLKAVIKLSFGVICEDANTPFRLMSANGLKQNIALVPDGFNLSNVLLTVIYTKSQQRIKYIPISFKPRRAGSIQSTFGA